MEDDKRETCCSNETAAACVMLYGGLRQRPERARAASHGCGAAGRDQGRGGAGVRVDALTLSRRENGPQHDRKTDSLAFGRAV